MIENLNEAYEAKIWVGNLGVAPNFAYISIAQYYLYLLVTKNKQVNLIQQTLKQLRKCTNSKKLQTTPDIIFWQNLNLPFPSH